MFIGRYVPAVLAAVLVTLSSCGVDAGNGDDDAPALSQESGILLSGVPSDALAIAARERCSEAVALLDSTHLLRRIAYGKLDKSKAIISWSYNSSLTPVLTIDVGRSNSNSEEASRICSQADSLGLYWRFYRADSLGIKRSMLILCPSESLMTAVSRHVSGGRSIMDAPDFPAALAMAGQSGNYTILRCSGAAFLMPGDFVKDIFPRRAATRFLQSVSDWITIVPSGRSGYRLYPVKGGEPSYFSNMLEALPYSPSRLGEILPSDTEFAISLPISLPAFRQEYEKYLDASVRLTAYNRQIEALGKNCGKNPLNWEKENDVREVALVFRAGKAVVLVRPAKGRSDSEAHENAYRGFTGSLYGSAFSLADDYFAASKDGWTVIGSEEAVNDFLSADTQGIKWPSKAAHIVMYKSGHLLCWDKKGIYLWFSNQ